MQFTGNHNNLIVLRVQYGLPSVSPKHYIHMPVIVACELGQVVAWPNSRYTSVSVFMSYVYCPAVFCSPSPAEHASSLRLLLQYPGGAVSYPPATHHILWSCRSPLFPNYLTSLSSPAFFLYARHSIPLQFPLRTTL